MAADISGNVNGNVRLSDFDLGIIIGIGGQLDSIKNQWYLPINWYLTTNDNKYEPIKKALIVEKKSEPTHTDMDVPLIAFSRDNVVNAANRIQSPTTAYRIPAPGATMVNVNGQIGWTSYIVKDQEEPYDMYYTLECWGRSRVVAQQLMETVIGKYPTHGKVKVKDSLGTIRTYAVYQQSVTDLTQVSSMVDRLACYAVSIKVEGELTSTRGAPYEVPAFTGGTSTIPPDGMDPDLIDTDGDGIPDLPPGGLYGDGKPIIRAGLIQDV